MSIIDKIRISFNSGEDFQFQQRDIDELEQIKKTLEWYANVENYKTYEYLQDCKEIAENWTHAVDEDSGYAARLALRLE